MKRAATVALILILIGFPAGATASDRLRLGGYNKVFFVVLHVPEALNPGGAVDPSFFGSVTNRIRLDGRYRFSDRLAFAIAYDFAPRVQDRVLFAFGGFATGTVSPGYRAEDIDERLFPRKREDLGSFAIHQNLDRAFVTWRAPKFDVYVGRQAIAWGSSRVINATDMLAPFAYDELDTEDRSGVDAVRLRIPIGALAEVDAGYVAGDGFDIEKSAFFIRGQSNVARSDVSALLVAFRDNLLAGVDLTRPVAGAGVWLEVAHVFVGAMGGASPEDDDYFRGSLGLDFGIGGRTYGFIEYHYNGPGVGEPADYAANIRKAAYSEGAVYLLGRHYVAPGVTYQVTPLLVGAGQALVNLSDPSALIAPSLEYNVAEDVYLGIGAFVGIGRGPVRPPGFPMSPEFRSEFGGYADVYFTSFRVYF